MFTFYFKWIFDKTFLAHSGKVFADSVDEALSKILAKCDIEAVREQTKKTEGGRTTYILDVTQTGDACIAHIEFYQEPSLFDEIKIAEE